MTHQRAAWPTTPDLHTTDEHGHDDTCRCGQALDCCTREHCPRCGAEVRRPALV